MPTLVGNVRRFEEVYIAPIALIVNEVVFTQRKALLQKWHLYLNDNFIITKNIYSFYALN